MRDFDIPTVGITAPSGTGKTTLLTRLIPLLNAQGIRVGLIKKTHHDIELDRPGKDSYLLRLAGANPVMLSSPRRRILVTEFPKPGDGSLAADLACFDPAQVDLILVEGYRNEAFPKIELHRLALGCAPLHPEDSNVVAVATDDPNLQTGTLPRLELNRPESVAEFLLEYLSPHATA